MAQTTALLALSLLLTLLSTFWAPTGADVPRATISQSIFTGRKGDIQILLICKASGIQEPIHFNWSTNKGHLPSYAVPNCYQLFLRNESIGTTFICQVSNGWKMANASWTVRPFGFPSKQSNRYLSVLFVVLFILGGMLNAWYYRKSRQKQHSTSENEWTRLNPAPPEIGQQRALIPRMF